MGTHPKKTRSIRMKLVQIDAPPTWVVQEEQPVVKKDESCSSEIISREKSACMEHMDVGEPEPATVFTTAQETTTKRPPIVTTTPLKKKKKKKAKKSSYKSLMADMMNNSSCSDKQKTEREKEALRLVTGGGAFSKIDKI